MRSIFCLSSVLLLAAVSQAAVLFTAPTNGTVWQAGQNVTIKWQAAPGSQLTPNNVTFQLLQGDAKAPTVVAPALATAPESAGQVNVTVAANATSGNYTLRAGVNGTVSVSFAINGTAAVNNTKPTTTTPTTTTTPPAPEKKSGASSLSAGGVTLALAVVVGML
jgi:hypothetical protein